MVGAVKQDIIHALSLRAHRRNTLTLAFALAATAADAPHNDADALRPQTGELWAVVQERDGLGDNLPSDDPIRVREGGFYGWPMPAASASNRRRVSRTAQRRWKRA